MLKQKPTVKECVILEESEGEANVAIMEEELEEICKRGNLCLARFTSK